MRAFLSGLGRVRPGSSTSLITITAASWVSLALAQGGGGSPPGGSCSTAPTSQLQQALVNDGYSVTIESSQASGPTGWAISLIADKSFSTPIIFDTPGERFIQDVYMTLHDGTTTKNYDLDEIYDCQAGTWVFDSWSGVRDEVLIGDTVTFTQTSDFSGTVVGSFQFSDGDFDLTQISRDADMPVDIGTSVDGNYKATGYVAKYSNGTIVGYQGKETYTHGAYLQSGGVLYRNLMMEYQYAESPNFSTAYDYDEEDFVTGQVMHSIYPSGFDYRDNFYRDESGEFVYNDFTGTLMRPENRPDLLVEYDDEHTVNSPETALSGDYDLTEIEREREVNQSFTYPTEVINPPNYTLEAERQDDTADQEIRTETEVVGNQIFNREVGRFSTTIDAEYLDRIITENSDTGWEPDLGNSSHFFHRLRKSIEAGGSVNPDLQLQLDLDEIVEAAESSRSLTSDWSTTVYGDVDATEIINGGSSVLDCLDLEDAIYDWEIEIERIGDWTRFLRLTVPLYDPRDEIPYEPCIDD